MAFGGAGQLQKQGGWAPVTFAQKLTTLTGRNYTLQWVIAGLVGVVLGIYTLGISTLPMQWTFLFILAVLCPFIVMIVGNLRRLLLAVILLDIPFQADTYLNYHKEAAALGALGGLNISIATLFLVVLYALWLAELLTKVDAPSYSLFRVSLPLASYLAIVTLSVVVAHNVNLAIFEIFLLWQTFLLYIYIVNSVRTRQDVLFIVIMLLTGLVLESLVMIGLRFIGYSITIGSIFARIDDNLRVSGTVGSPSDAASYLSLLLAPALSILLTGLGQSYKGLATLAFCLGTVALLLTFSRGGWIAFVLSVTILCLLAWYRGWLSLTVPLAIGVVAMLLSLLFWDAISTRLLGDDNGSAYSRLPLIRIAFRMIMDNFVFGVGANNFAVVMMQYAKLKFSGAWLYTVHNKYLLVWAETGIGGLVTFIWFLLTSLYRGWQGWKFNDRVLSSLSLGFTVSVVGHMIYMSVELFNSRPQVQMLWLIAGLITAMRNMAGRN